MKFRMPVASGWTLRLETDRVVPAEAGDLRVTRVAAAVPGCVHTDLLAAGLIPDPYLDRAEEQVAWVGKADWRYGTQIAAARTGAERTDLVFEGLDTVAEISLAGRGLGRTRNMHRTYRFEVTDLVGADPVELEVGFTSAYVEAERMRGELGERPCNYPEPFSFIRKMACSFGWDWGPTLVTAGIWRPVYLEQWSTARLAQVRPHVTVEGANGNVRADLEIERTENGANRPLRAELSVGDRRAVVEIEPGCGNATLELTVPEAALWWPRGYGEQNLHPCRIMLLDAESGVELDEWHRRIGFRSVELDTTADEHGSAFTLVVNGVPVFARGVNWIPDDAFPSRVTPLRYRERLEQAAAIGVDLVRVWGGGIYEDDAFYEACDELGLMVWQDFLFACAAYPEEEPLRSEVEAEARENIARLMPHASLVLWNGNNENLWGFNDWGWKDRLAGATWGEGYYLGLLPKLAGELDPTRPYWAGTPWSGSWEHEPNDPGHGTVHSWEVWNRRDYADYHAEVPRFVAEFGWQAPATYATIKRAISDRPLAPDTPGMLHHQKAQDGQGKLDRGLADHFEVPGDFDRWHYLTQLNQARAVAAGIEHWRSHWPRCAGSIVWQLNDCWPVTSWAAIDGDGRAKPLYRELARLYSDRLLSFQQRDGALVLTAANQGAAPWTGVVTVRRVGADGRVLAEHEAELAVPARAVSLLALPAGITQNPEPDKELWVADQFGTKQERAVYFACPDREFAYPAARMDVDVRAEPGPDRTTTVTVTAHTLVRDLLLQPDRLHPDARTDRGRITLLPGERVDFVVEGWDGADYGRLTGALYCVNDQAADGESR